MRNGESCPFLCGGGSTDGDVQLIERVAGGSRAGMPTLDQGAGQMSFEQSGQNRPATYFSAFPEQMECQGVRS